MSKIDLVSREWCDIVFEGRNKEYGAYRMRANAGKRQLRALLIVIVLLAAVLAVVGINAVVKNLTKGDEQEFDAALEMAQLKKEEKKEEKKEKEIELKYEEPKPEKVAVKASIQFTIPKIVDDDKVVKDNELKSQDELTQSKAAISSATYKGDVGGTINMDDLQANQPAGGTATPEVEEEKVYNVVEVMPTFPGGEQALLAYIGKNLKYPSIAQEQEIQGVVVVRFVVLEDGTVGDAVIQKGLHPECDKAAVKVVKSLPRFIPGKQQGKPVKVWFTCPIRFVIQ